MSTKKKTEQTRFKEASLTDKEILEIRKRFNITVSKEAIPRKKVHQINKTRKTKKEKNGCLDCGKNTKNKRCSICTKKKIMAYKIDYPVDNRLFTR